MAQRHKFTAEEAALGLQRALRNPRTPKHLRPFIKKRLSELRPKARREREARKRRRPGIFDFLGF